LATEKSCRFLAPTIGNIVYHNIIITFSCFSG